MVGPLMGTELPPATKPVPARAGDAVPRMTWGRGVPVTTSSRTAWPGGAARRARLGCGGV